VARKETQHPRRQVDPRRLPDPVTQQPEPVLLMPALSGGQREKDIALLAFTTLCQIPIDRCLRTFVGKTPTPSPHIGVRAPVRVHDAIIAASGPRAQAVCGRQGFVENP
jgi:hypothetical protein